MADFTRHLTLADADLKGQLFATPAGPVSILWSRKDGYVLNADHGPDSGWFAAPEPWVDPWRTKTRLSVAAAPGVTTARELDCIGRERKPAVCDGRVELRLDGAPRVYYGLTDTPDAGRRH